MFTFLTLDGRWLWNFVLPSPHLGTFQLKRWGKTLSMQVVMTFIYKMEQGEKESLLPWGHQQEGAALDSVSGGGDQSALDKPRDSSSLLRRVKNVGERSHLPGLPESPHRTLPASPSPSRPKRQCQQNSQPPFESRSETQQTGGPGDKGSQPTCQVAGRGRIRPPATSR